MSVDIVVRLQNFDRNTPFAKDLALEAADEIEKLRSAIQKHRQEVWGEDAPDHAADIALYGHLGVVALGLVAASEGENNTTK